MEHMVGFENGYDCINFECVNGSDRCNPGSGGSHGKHGLSIRFVAKGDDGAVQFLLSTRWLPQYIQPDNIGVRDLELGGPAFPVDLGYHSKKPRYDGQGIIDNECALCDGQPCYYDGSGLNANDAMYALVNGGDSALWEFLDAYYEFVFNNGTYPVPSEFKVPTRNKVVNTEHA